MTGIVTPPRSPHSAGPQPLTPPECPGLARSPALSSPDSLPPKSTFVETPRSLLETTSHHPANPQPKKLGDGQYSLESMLLWAKENGRNFCFEDDWILPRAQCMSSKVQECLARFREVCGNNCQISDLTPLMRNVLDASCDMQHWTAYPLCKDGSGTELYLEITPVSHETFRIGQRRLWYLSDFGRELVLTGGIQGSFPVIGIGYLTPSPDTERVTDWIVVIDTDGMVWFLKEDNLTRKDRLIEQEDPYEDERTWVPDYSRYDAVFGGGNIVRFRHIERVERGFRDVEKTVCYSGHWETRPFTPESMAVAQDLGGEQH